MQKMYHKLAFSPAQRFILFSASHDREFAIPSNLHGAYRDFMQDLHLREAAKQIRVFQGGEISPKVRADHTPNIFHISKETAEFIVHILSNTVFTAVGLDILDEIPDAARRIVAGDFWDRTPEKESWFDSITDLKLWTIAEEELPPLPLK